MNSYVPEYKIQKFTNKTSDTLLIIPVINEGSRILNQLKNINNLDYPIDVAIADGGSTDGSIDDVKLLKSLGVNFLLTKLGPGNLSAQLLTAFDFALQMNYKYVITMDGNGKDEPMGILKIEEALKAGYDFVQGSRFVDGGLAVNTPMVRKLAIQWLHAPITSLASRRKFTDTTNGFRGFSIGLLKSKNIGVFRETFNSYELIFYMPIRASRTGFRVLEVPVTRSYPTSGNIPTKIHGMSTYLRLLKMLCFASIGKYNPTEKM